MTDSPGKAPVDGSGRRRSPRDTWWFSPMLQIVAGGAVVGFQWGPIAAGEANWLNWLVAGAGLVVLVFGVKAWNRARLDHR